MLTGAPLGGGSAYSFCIISMVVWWGLPLRKLFNSCAVMLPAFLTRCVQNLCNKFSTRSNDAFNKLMEMKNAKTEKLVFTFVLFSFVFYVLLFIVVIVVQCTVTALIN